MLKAIRCGCVFPQTVQGVSAETLAPVYYRAVAPRRRGAHWDWTAILLTFTSYSLLPEAEQGAVRYFRRQEKRSAGRGGSGGLRGLSRSRAGAGTLTSARSSVWAIKCRLTRRVIASTGVGTMGWGRSGGWVVDRGRLVRLRFASRVYLQGTRLGRCRAAERSFDRVAGG